MKFKTKVVNGDILISDSAREYVKTLPEDSAIELSIKPYKLTRSDRQHRYYFGVVITTISNDTGYTKEEVHQIMKQKFLWQVTEFNGKFYETSKSTTNLTTSEMELYLRNIREFANIELGIFVRLPNEDYYE